MANETPQQTSPEEESKQPALQEEVKKDTVRINLPPGLGGRTGAPSPPTSATSRVKLAPSTGSPEEEAKKGTSVIGMPVAVPKPKKDTSRVQVTAAKPPAPEAPRSAVRLKREEPAPTAAPATASGAPTKPAPASVTATAPSAVDAGLAIGAIVLSIAVLVYLAMVAMG